MNIFFIDIDQTVADFNGQYKRFMKKNPSKEDRLDIDYLADRTDIMKFAATMPLTDLGLQLKNHLKKGYPVGSGWTFISRVKADRQNSMEWITGRCLWMKENFKGLNTYYECNNMIFVESSKDTVPLKYIDEDNINILIDDDPLERTLWEGRIATSVAYTPNEFSDMLRQFEELL